MGKPLTFKDGYSEEQDEERLTRLLAEIQRGLDSSPTLRSSYPSSATLDILQSHWQEQLPAMVETAMARN
jgi:hypothetical protein